MKHIFKSLKWCVKQCLYYGVWLIGLRWLECSSGAGSRQAGFNRRDAGKTLVVVDEGLPTPDRDAGSRTVVEFLKCLALAGWNIVFWPRNGFDLPAYSKRLRDMNVKVRAGFFRPPLSRWLLRSGHKADAFLLNRPAVAYACLNEIGGQSDIPIVYYGHDLHFERLRMDAEKKSNPALLARANEMLRLERTVWQRVDVVTYPSEAEVETVMKIAPGTVAQKLQAYCYEQCSIRDVSPASHNIVFVGGFNHPPNIDAVMWFSAEIFPLICRIVGDVKFIIAGSSPPKEIKGLASSNVEVTGWISEKQLDEIYHSSRVAVVPLRVGAGVKLKVVEAMSKGVPLVTTTVGAQGLENIGDCIPANDDPSMFAQSVIEFLMSSEAVWLSQSLCQIDYVNGHFSRQSMTESLLAAFRTAGVDCVTTISSNAGIPIS